MQALSRNRRSVRLNDVPNVFYNNFFQLVQDAADILSCAVSFALRLNNAASVTCFVTAVRLRCRLPPA